MKKSLIVVTAALLSVGCGGESVKEQLTSRGSFVLKIPTGQEIEASCSSSGSLTSPMNPDDEELVVLISFTPTAFYISANNKVYIRGTWREVDGDTIEVTVEDVDGVRTQSVQVEIDVDGEILNARPTDPCSALDSSSATEATEVQTEGQTPPSPNRSSSTGVSDTP